jgi:hypothetical protein
MSGKAIWFKTEINAAMQPYTPTPIPTNTPSPTDTQTPTETLTPTFTPIPIPGDFEVSTEGWGDYPENKRPIPDQGVRLNCTGLIQHTSNCSLEAYQLSEDKKNIGYDFYVARFANPEDAKSLISVWVYVPTPNPFCDEDNKCSTAKIIVLDQEFKPVEVSGRGTELDRPGWIEIKLDLHGTFHAEPYYAIGVHFFVITEYKGPFYIDTVTITQ